jgi:hypothetical protein
MKVLTAGHKYELANFEKKDEAGQVIQFIEKLPEGGVSGNPLYTVNDGTTNEEVIRMLLDRMNSLQAKFPCRENACAITKLDEALMWLEKRTRDRIARGVEGQHKA